MKQQCSVAKCPEKGLRYSDPPMCRNHISDWDGWYTNFIQARAQGQPLALERPLHIFPHLERDIYLKSVNNSDAYRVLSQSYITRTSRQAPESRADGAIRLQESFPELEPVITWILNTAAQGIGGNVAHSAVVALVNRVLKKMQMRGPSFEEVVLFKEYEHHRQEEHGSLLTPEDVSSNLENKAEERFRLIVEEDTKPSFPESDDCCPPHS